MAISFFNRQLNMDGENELAPVATESTVSITSLLDLRKIRAKVFAQLSLWDQKLLRLVCKDWNKTVEQLMRNMAKVLICINMGEENFTQNEDGYNITSYDELLTLLKRHVNVRDLTILGSEPEGFDSMTNEILVINSDAASEISLLERLEHLEFEYFDIGSEVFSILSELPQLSSILFKHCELTGRNLGALGDSIRHILIKKCCYLNTEHLIDSMKMLCFRGVPLSTFFVHNEFCSPLLPLAQYMLENFASLRILALHGYAHDIPPISPLKQILAVNLRQLALIGIIWPSKSHQNQFFATLLAQPLPCLTWLSYFANSFPLEAVTVKRFWDMCPKLGLMYVQHRTADGQELEERLSRD